MATKHMSSETLTTANIVGILAIFCCMGEFTIMMPSIAAFAQHFAGTDITTIMLANSITGVISVPVSIVSGALMNKTGFKPLAIIGILLMSFGGAFPFLMPDLQEYLYIISSRTIVGIGLGIIFPIGTATIIAFFDGVQRSRLLGMGITTQFVFSIILTTIAGFLTAVAWNYSFLTYLVSLIPLIAVIALMPEAVHVVRAKREAGEVPTQSGPKEKLPNAVWGYVIFALALWTTMVTVQTATSNVLEFRQLAGPAEAGLVINCCGLGCIVSGLVFPRLIKVFKDRLFGIAALVCAIGFIPCWFASNLPLYAFGVFLCGLGASAFFTSAQNATGNIIHVSRVPFVSGVLNAMMNLAGFIAPYIFAGSMAMLPAMGMNAHFPVIFVGALICAIIGLVHPMKSLTIKKADAPDGFASEEA